MRFFATATGGSPGLAHGALGAENPNRRPRHAMVIPIFDGSQLKMWASKRWSLRSESYTGKQDLAAWVLGSR